MGAGDGPSLSVRRTKAIPDARSAGIPSSPEGDGKTKKLAQLSHSTPEHPTPNLSLRSDCHRPGTAHRGPLHALAPWGTVCSALPSHMGLGSHQLGTPTRGSRETMGTRTPSSPCLPSPLFLTSHQVAPSSVSRQHPEGHEHFSRRPENSELLGALWTLQTEKPPACRSPALLGVVVLEDQGDGVRDQPLPGVQAHPTVLPRDAKQQVCRERATGADQGTAAM